jgi:hypothetical protein
MKETSKISLSIEEKKYLENARLELEFAITEYLKIVREVYLSR